MMILLHLNQLYELGNNNHYFIIDLCDIQRNVQENFNLIETMLTYHTLCVLALGNQRPWQESMSSECHEQGWNYYLPKKKKDAIKKSYWILLSKLGKLIQLKYISNIILIFHFHRHGSGMWVTMIIKVFTCLNCVQFLYEDERKTGAGTGDFLNTNARMVVAPSNLRIRRHKS